MIKIVAKQIVKADQINSYIKLMEELAEKTRQLDDGCIEYGLFQDIKNPQILTIIEEWENQDVLDRHMAAAHLKKIVPKLDAFYEMPGEVNFYQPAKTNE